jgi:hypothetical protein
MDLRAYVLQEIAGQDERGGAHPGTIRTMVDGRQKLYLTDEELQTALADLLELGYIRHREQEYTLSETMRSQVPRTSTGEVSMGRAAWERLVAQLGLGAG